MNAYIPARLLKTQNVVWTIAFWFIGGGILGFHLTEPETDWSRAIQWVIMFVVTPGSDFEPTNPLSAWFQSLYGIVNFGLLSLALSTIIIPPMLKVWSARTDGTGKYHGYRGHLIVDAIDWEKVWSIVRELQNGSPTKEVQLVIVSNTLEEMPIELHKLGVRYVKGNLRAKATYERAGIAHARAAIICSSDYQDPDKGDASSSAYVELIERYRSEIVTVAEIILARNEDLFLRGDGHVFFDPTMLGAVALSLRHAVGSAPVCINFEQMRSSGELVDEDQESELRQQLQLAGVITSDSGIPVRIILPTDLNDPSASDLMAHTKAMRSGEQVEVVIPVCLSVESVDLFEDWPLAVCVDQIMAQALVAELRERDVI